MPPVSTSGSTSNKALLGNGLVMPGDFPSDAYEAIHHKVRPLSASQSALYAEFAGAWNAIALRYLSLTKYGDEFTTSLKSQGTSPGPEARYEQERLVFGFFSNGFSVFESLFYGTFAIGALLKASQFPLSTPADQRKITPTYTLQLLEKAFPGDALVAELRAIVDDAAYQEWREIRNILTHRAAPGRTFFVTVGSDAAPTDRWKIRDIPLDAAMTSARRANASRLLSRAAGALKTFVETRL